MVTKVDEPLVTVETSSEVETAEEGRVVAPATPLRPDSVVVPVTVNVEPLVVRVAVKVDVPTADEEPEPKMVVDPVVEVMVEPLLVTTVTRPEVVMAEEVTEPPAPPAPPPAPPVELPPVELEPRLVVVTVTEAAVVVVVVRPEVTAAQTELPQATALAAAL